MKNSKSNSAGFFSLFNNKPKFFIFFDRQSCSMLHSKIKPKTSRYRARLQALICLPKTNLQTFGIYMIYLYFFFELGLLLILFQSYERKLEKMVVELNRKPLTSNYCDERLSFLCWVSGIPSEENVKTRNIKP